MTATSGLKSGIVLSYVVVLVVLIAGTATTLNPAAPPRDSGNDGMLPNQDNGTPPPQDDQTNQGNPSDPEPPEEVANCSSMPLAHFMSEQQLSSYLSNVPNYTGGGTGYPRVPAGGGTIGLLDNSGSSPSYLGTNNQVQGVDEADIAKTDGDYIYMIQNKSVVVIRAYPPGDAAVLSRILTDDYPVGLFVNGNWLAVITSEASNSYYYYYQPYYFGATGISLYDVSDRESPIRDRNYTIEASYIGSRMIGEYVYLVGQYSFYRFNSDLTYPSIWAADSRFTLGYKDIGYFNDSRGANDMLMVVSVRMPVEEPFGFEAVLTADSSDIYVSASNVYAAADVWRNIENLSRPLTAVHKFHIADGDIHYICTGEVPGWILDQYSMDEYEGNLRIATQGSGAGSNVYVLDNRLLQLGKLEGLAPGENMYSSRFLGDRGYLVTFQKIDPLFAIDLSDPKAPQVLGYLKIPGFSDYMHPYDENHIIGLGKDTVEGQGGGFSWYQGVKVSLFDVTDIEHPVEESKVVIGDRLTFSIAQIDHRAFMFDSARGILVLPIELYEIDRTLYPNPDPWQYGDFVWQGVYVLSVTLDNGIQVIGRISHLDSWIDGGYSCQQCAYFGIRRSLLIGEYLYTLSPALMKVNDLGTLQEVKRVQL